jgi:hypothetical protein
VKNWTTDLLERRAGVPPARDPPPPARAGPPPYSGLHKRPHGHGQELIGAVANDDVLGPAIMQPGQFVAEQLGRGIGIKAQPSIYRGPNCRQDAGRGRIRILVRVELDQALNLRLFTGDIGIQSAHEGADQQFQVAQ